MFLGDADFESAKKSDLKKFKMNRSSEKDKIIEDQAELIKNLQKQIKEWEEWKASSKTYGLLWSSRLYFILFYY